MADKYGYACKYLNMEQDIPWQKICRITSYLMWIIKAPNL